MLDEKKLLGKIFISYSSKDRRFVKRLSNWLNKAEYDTWLDEHELIAGDQIVEKISEALSLSKVVLIVISEFSLKSKWLKFEINNATELMIQGKCRIIPLVIDKSDLLPEVRGILYADFTRSFKHGLKAVLLALDYEVKHRLFNDAKFWQQIEIILKKVFGSIGFIYTMGEYKSEDYSCVSLIKKENEEEISIIYDIISAYETPAKPLNKQWWYEYQSAIENAPDNMSLVISERPVGFKTELVSLESDRVLYKIIDNIRMIVFIDMSGIKDLETRISLLEVAKKHFISHLRNSGKCT